MTVRLKPVEEQVVVITGASSGIGLATAHLFAERGARLVLVARNEEALRQAADDCERRGSPRAIVVAGDVADRAALERVARTAIKTFGGFDTWINDAAVALYGKLWETPIEDQRRLFEVNYWGLVHGSLIAAEHLRGRGGALINVGSVLSERAMIYQSQYSAAKHAVKAFTDGLRMEMEREGFPISVTLIKPSAIDTPYMEHARNHLDSPGVVTPPPAYDPHLVAKAMVFAAENPKRELTIGFGGFAIAAMGTLAPRLTDYAMEAAGYGSQTTDNPGRQQRRDNLYQHREDGDAYSSLPGGSRKTSLFLEAQMRPASSFLLLAGIGLAASLLLRAGGEDRAEARARAAASGARFRGRMARPYGVRRFGRAQDGGAALARH